MSSPDDIFLLIDRILHLVVLRDDILTKDDFHRLKNSVYAEYRIATAPSASAFIARYRTLVRDGRLPELRRVSLLLRKRAVRSLSGVSVISILTRPHPCPWACIYCPNDPALPKSYVAGEPAVMRAERNAFNPMHQIWNRLTALERIGHTVDKCDIRIIGGTWSSYPEEYRESFIRDIYDAHSDYRRFSKTIGEGMIHSDTSHEAFSIPEDYRVECSNSLDTAKVRNESSISRVIGIAVETRPDTITIPEIVRLRRYGVTRVEIGYQTTDDTINHASGRWHGNAESIHATRLLKDAGLKVVAHIMPWLPWSTPERDIQSVRDIIECSDFRPDELKIYPTVVVDSTVLANMWRRGEYVPYDDVTTIGLMADILRLIPEWVRINRVYRDIPATEILAGCRIANLRQKAEERIGHRILDISGRELRDRTNDKQLAILDTTIYDASGGREYFLQYIDPMDRTLFSLLRLRIPSGDTDGIDILSGLALIRELHTFGDQARIGESDGSTSQHSGFGRRLIGEAERIVCEVYPHLRGIAVTSGVGARPYYRRLGYTDVGEYMMKEW